MAVAGHERAVAEIMIDIFVAIQIVDARAVAVAHKQRVGRIVAVVAGYAERDTIDGPLMGLAGFGRALFVGLDFALEGLVHAV